MRENRIFEDGAEEYDKWFDENQFAYKSEVLALGKFIPKNSKGLEVGVGTGRFAAPIGIQMGVEPARAMADIARKRGIEVYESKKKDSKFYRYAHFYSVNQVLKWVRKLGYCHIKICQTIFKNPGKITAIEPVKDGSGRGGFVVISAQKDVRRDFHPDHVRRSLS